MKYLNLLLMAVLAWSSDAVVAQGNETRPTEKPFVIGTTTEIYSKLLNEKRVLNIYLPDDYKKDDTVHYPVIYLLDGGADEDFIHVVGLVQFNSFPWIGRLPKSIVVGIANTDRRRDFTYPTTLEEDQKLYPGSGHSDRFISFLEKELQPYVQKHYKVSTTKTLIGESLGGLVATEVLFKEPRLFNQYIIVSPSLWWDNGSLLGMDPVALKDSTLPLTKIYIGVGKEGVWPAKVPHVMEVDANLLADKLKGLKQKSLQVFFDYLPGENHATIDHQALIDAFRLLSPQKTE